MTTGVIEGIPRTRSSSAGKWCSASPARRSSGASSSREGWSDCAASPSSSPSSPSSRSSTPSCKRASHWWSIDFFTKIPQFPSLIDPNAIGGISNAIIGSLVIDGIAAIFAIPIGVIAGLFLAESDVEVREPRCERRPRS